MKFISAALMICAITLPRYSQAQAEAQTDAGVASPNVPASIVLSANVGSSGLDKEALRSAIERELKVPVSLVESESANLRVQVAGARGQQRVTVSFRPDSSQELTRSMELSDDPARALDTIAWLAGNLTRNEAAELAAQLSPPTTSAQAGELPSDTPEKSAAESAPRKGEAPAKGSKSEQRTSSRAPQRADSDEPKLERTRGFAWDLSVLHPLTLFGDSERRVLNFELGLFYSNVGALNGFGMNLIVHRAGDVNGVQIAMPVTIARDVEGLQLAAGFGRARDLEGAQIAGAVSVARDLNGAQIAGAVNAARDAKGAQIAGGVNVARDVSGASLAPVNVARSINGVQLGVINIAERVDGTQIGAINIAKEVKGTSVGAVSIAGNGRVQPVVWSNNTMPVNLAAKFTVGFMYTQLGAGLSPESERWRTETGLGGHLRLGNIFFEPGLHYAQTRPRKNADKVLRNDLIYRGAVGYDFRYVSVFAGAGLVHEVESSEPLEGEFFGGVAFF